MIDNARFNLALDTYEKVFNASFPNTEKGSHNIALEAAIEAYNNNGTAHTNVHSDTITFVLQPNHSVEKVGDIMRIWPAVVEQK